ncbi:retrotransposon protein, putative, ty1-copia subclass [Tanacetum coccineum]
MGAPCWPNPIEDDGNNSVFKSFFEKQKLTGPNFIDWYRQLRIVLSAEDKESYLEHPIPVAPVAAPGQQVPPQALAAHDAWVKGSKEIAEQELLQTVREFHACKQEEGQSVSSYVYDGFVQNYNMHSMGKTQEGSRKTKRKKLHKAAKGNQGKGKAKKGNALVPALSFAPKPKNPPTPKKDNPAKDTICHQCDEAGHWRRNCPVYLAELLKKKKLSQGASTSGIFTIELYSFPIKSLVYDTGCGIHICITTQGLRGSRKLKPGALSLYVGDGHRAAVEAIREFHLCFPSGLVLILHNCHYAPSITRGIILVSHLYNDGFVNRFDGNVLSVSRNNLVYFSDIPRDGIYEIDLSSSNTNDSSMYDVSNKRAKLNLDSTLLWHCRLGHIIENQLGKNIKSLRSDRGGEYMSQEFLNHLKEHGIIAHRTPPYTPQHNGVSERRNRTLLDMVHSMMSQTTLLKSFWDYALESIARILNMVPTKKVDKIPYEVWHGQAPKLSYLKVWGCEALVKRDTLTKLDKLEPRSINLITQEASGSLEDLEIIQEEDTQPSIDISLHHDNDDQKIDKPQSDINPIRRSTRTRRATDRLCLHVDAKEHKLGDLGEPANYKAALLDPESEKWRNAMNVEMQSMKDNEVWDLVDLPPNGKTVGSKWLFKKKTDMDGAEHTYKARLVAKGFTKTYRVDYEETFSPVADIRAIRILIAIAAFYDYEIWQMDVKIAFLNGHLIELKHVIVLGSFIARGYLDLI